MYSYVIEVFKTSYHRLMSKSLLGTWNINRSFNTLMLMFYLKILILIRTDLTSQCSLIYRSALFITGFVQFSLYSLSLQLMWETSTALVHYLDGSLARHHSPYVCNLHLKSCPFYGLVCVMFPCSTIVSAILTFT